MKKCRVCENEKPLSEFFARGAGRRSECKTCTTAANKRNAAGPKQRAAKSKRDAAWRKANPSKAHGHAIKNLYGIDKDDYAAMLHAQGGVCAVCQEAEEGVRLSVDHDHETRKVRGLLCGACNRMLGLAKEDIGVLRASIVYLERWLRSRGKAA